MLHTAILRQELETRARHTCDKLHRFEATLPSPPSNRHCQSIASSAVRRRRAKSLCMLGQLSPNVTDALPPAARTTKPLRGRVSHCSPRPSYSRRRRYCRPVSMLDTDIGVAECSPVQVSALGVSSELTWWRPLTAHGRRQTSFLWALDQTHTGSFCTWR